MRVAGIDCGTNSIRLLVADAVRDEESGAVILTDVRRRMEVVRLGQGVDTTGRLDEQALARTLAMAGEYAQECRDLGVEPGRVRFVATSASRDAENAADFVAGVERTFAGLEVSPEVVTGEEEAGLSFAGATVDLVAAGTPGPYLVVDLGGGSTEFARGAHEVVASRSMDIGCVRLTERHLHSDPPTQGEVDAARVDIGAALDQAESSVGFGGLGALVGVAGTITTVTAHALGLATYDSAAIHLAALSTDEVYDSAASLLSLTRAERADLPFMHPGRVDVIGAGALIWYDTVGRVSEANGPELPVIASEKDILDGIALSVAERLL